LTVKLQRDHAAVSGTLNYTCDAATKTYTLLGLEAEMLQDGKPPGMAYSAAVGSTVCGIYLHL
jgi:hypothetical protein